MTGLDQLDSVGSLVVLVIVLFVVGEVLAEIPGVAFDENPLAFVGDWLGKLTDGQNDENSDSDGGLW